MSLTSETELKQGWVVAATQGPNHVEGRVNDDFKIGAGYFAFFQIVTDGGSVIEVNTNHWDIEVLSKGEPEPTTGKVIRGEFGPGVRNFLAWAAGDGTWDVIGPYGDYTKGVKAGALRKNLIDTSHAVEGPVSFVELVPNG